MCAALPSCEVIFSQQFDTPKGLNDHYADALSFFLPIILRDMGYSKTNALLLVRAPAVIVEYLKSLNGHSERCPIRTSCESDYMITRLNFQLM